MMEKLLSHPDKNLFDHLFYTANNTLKIIENKNYNFWIDYDGEKYNLNKVLIDLAWLVGAFHDIGKATIYFQNYIRNPENIHDNKKSHSLLSALFVYFVSTEYLKNKNVDNRLKELLAVFCFNVVKRHHGKLDNLSNELFIEDFFEILKEQVVSIDNETITDIIDKLLQNFDFKIDWNDFKIFIIEEKFKNDFVDFSFDFLDDELSNLTQDTRLTLFFYHQLLYSVLLFSDKNDVINPGDILTCQNDIFRKSEEFRETMGFNNPKTEINKIKNQALNESLQNLDIIFDKQNHIYSITLPTGLGKTITSFMLADKIRKKLDNRHSKIIITIPFTSIIDQNFEVYAEILKTRNSNIILKHHHLVEPLYKINENVADYDKSEFLIETWQSDVVVTTFVQLLETIFSCDKNKLMKLSQLSGSIIVMDEIQSIPYEFWEPIREGFKIISKTFDLYFILISATQPLIFNPDNDITELVPNYKKYFNFFNRTKLQLYDDPIEFDKFKAIILEYLLTFQKKDILIIVNTKNAAKNLFEYICNEIDTDQDEIYFLTTLITPFERKKIIDLIKQKSDKRKIIISTQLVEAGVDISVDTVFRQFAPLDSIIQAAGRANRYSEKENISEVFIYDIKELKKANSLIYGSDLLFKTLKVFKEFNKTEFYECEFIKIIEKYFIEVSKQADNKSNKILPAMINFNFSNVNLNLIDSVNTEAVYIQLNEKAKLIWEKYVEIYSNNNLKPWEKKRLFYEIKSYFYDFVINVPIPWDSDSIEFDSEKEFGFYVSKLECPSVNYSYDEYDFTKNTGYNYNSKVVQIL